MPRKQLADYSDMTGVIHNYSYSPMSENSINFVDICLFIECR